MNSHFFVFITLLFCFSACQTATQSNNTNNNPEKSAYPTDTLKSYYYPLAQLKDGLIYEYAYLPSNQTAYYWFFKTVVDEAGNWNLIGTRYGANFETEATTRERVYPNGMAYEMYQFLVLDTASGKDKVYPHNIISPTSFPFEIASKQGQVYRFQSTFNLPPDMTLNYKFTRDRQFSKFTNFNYEQQSKPAIELTGFDYLVLSDSIKGGYFTLDSSAIKETYIKDIGLVYIERQAPNKQIVVCQLKARYVMDSFLLKIPESVLPKNRRPQQK